ncbi:Cephalosporin hydroxylase [Aquipseudomonas alcaligenes]|uniref:cephalosporin hydroxylase family protein n=1 Tax=Aquipseudomonas alcaligenes TaxID=43263 RepID=UPI00095428FD|nr:CmcI family methyltransferase [Pseudomonas alcaligenes]SIR93648.1 Cephalosporin hydroxylase [Pseudomonas alcaligenes]
MKISIDTESRTLDYQSAAGSGTLPLYSKEAFHLISDVWIKQEWNQLHWQSFSWLGFQIWQLPEDVLRLQEVLAKLQPDLIIETGINNGGSCIFFASLCRLLGRGRVVSIDIQIPAQVREAIATSPLADLITLIEGDSVSEEVASRVREQVRPGESVFVFLDSDHHKAHVLSELEAYAPLVTPGSYIVAADGVMERLTETPNGDPHWTYDNPAEAARAYAASHPEFAILRPTALFGDDKTLDNLTYWPDAWLYRRPS